MPQIVTMGAMMMCTMGASPSTLMITPENMTNAANKPAATIMDNIPMKNIMPFGVCRSPANPQVAAATAAPPPGVLKPQPCIPVTTAPWMPPSPKVMIKNKPALLSTAKLMCNWAGVISFTNPGQMNVQS